jgi:hypothetical protein
MSLEAQLGSGTCTFYHPRKASRSERVPRAGVVNVLATSGSLIPTSANLLSRDET